MAQGRRLSTAMVAVVLSFCATASATDWKEVRVLPAPEANQAAAADDRFFYAIDNRRVAKYDRESGQRTAISVGEAEHLNSGYFHDGTLLCAHSNFPKTPERSEILALDPATMRLEPYKNFGNYGGSLTWVVRRDDDWWCNFARYGDSNDETFLVRFDDDWQETGRWTYPPEVIRELGRYSLSGGLWRDGSLLVTGHDAPIVFQLVLPEQGDVLELVDRSAVPFSGQAFAQDPVTGGLVGIRRSKRHIVLAVPAVDESADSSSCRLRSAGVTPVLPVVTMR